ncbi:TetR/AcrR family transcriptional regulator [Actinacidiphila glaucinigra]|uniref:TetR/AcrR family transcriptional regulator n=1 Tax=Actinacidiphila glaucinigra TaxID=235986 RepID=UPI00366D7755
MLTKKGAATKARIIAGAAQLVAVKGAAETCLEDIRAATGTSKSQLFHYFPEGKTQLLLAVAEDCSQRVLEQQRPLLDGLDSWEAWEQWQELILRLNAPGDGDGYCTLTALSGQSPQTVPGVRELLADHLERWHAALTKGLTAMRADGLLREDADVDELATAVLAAVQGGAMMGRITGSTAPLRTALTVTVDHLRTWAPPPPPPPAAR